MVKQYYIVEIKRVNGELEHNVTWAYDEDADKARLKGESAYYTKLAEACLSNTDSHSVTLISDEGFPVMHACYKHTYVPVEPVEGAE